MRSIFMLKTVPLKFGITLEACAGGGRLDQLNGLGIDDCGCLPIGKIKFVTRLKIQRILPTFRPEPKTEVDPKK
jgi:hypothetical protein